MAGEPAAAEEEEATAGARPQGSEAVATGWAAVEAEATRVEGGRAAAAAMGSVEEEEEATAGARPQGSEAVATGWAAAEAGATRVEEGRAAAAAEAMG